MKPKYSKVLAAVRAALARNGLKDASLLASETLQPEEKAQAYLMIARFQRGRRLYPPALDYYNRAFQLSQGPSKRDACFEAARILLQLNASSEAVDLLTEGLKTAPEDAAMLLLLARAHAVVGQFEEARSLLSPLIASAALNVKMSDNVAEAFRSLLKERSTASLEETDTFKLLRQTYENYPGMPDVARVYGERLLTSGDVKAALLPLTQAFENYSPGARRDAVRERLIQAHATLGLDLPEKLNESKAAIQAPNILEPFRVAAITNVFNEKHNLPIWLKHYGNQVGIKQCIVLDHGSNDGSTDNLNGAGVVRLARRELFNETYRMSLINNMANDLLGYYDAVIYSDCDEMFVVDPDLYENIVDYARQTKKPACYAIGLNVRHNPAIEPDLNSDEPVLEQRTLCQFTSAMCKPLLIRKPVSWGGGFHACEHQPGFDDAYLFHLRHADMRQALERLAVTRQVKFAREGGGKHHRRDADDLVNQIYKRMENTEVRDDFDFVSEKAEHISNYSLSASGRYSCDKAVNVNYVNRIPERFRSVV